MKLGCCYYPEHWPEEIWADDAQRMAEMGLELVRIGEFSWSRIEPEPGQYDWDWLDRAIDTLSQAGLKVILGTPTATPPKWLVDQMPDMIAIDASGNARKFGSRRHYCFSHRPYRDECARIVTAMAERFGKHPAISAWQTDNEYGCHETTISYSHAAAAAFRVWLAQKYDDDVQRLNAAWGNVFWSMEYRSFDEIDPPNLTVTEANPSHVLDYRRFASDEVVSFNRLQAEILRAHSPGRDITHNFMGFVTDFDHHDVGADCDVATWDSYPLGFLEQFWFTDDEKNRYARQGHPDIAAFHHDLYRGCSNGRWAVMEQQPGPVNWARYNPAPLPGMVRLWTLEAMAHGAEFCSFFRWRQAPIAQEQMHAGLLRPDSVEDQGGQEARQAADDIAAIGPLTDTTKSVALLFSYEAAWLFEAQPQGQNFRYIELVFETYSALRQLGLNVDILSPDARFEDHQMIIAPSLPILTDDLVSRLSDTNVPILIGPRSGSKTADFQIPPELAPGPLQSKLPIKVTRVESLRPGLAEESHGEGKIRWFEHIATSLTPERMLKDNTPMVFQSRNIRYLAAWPDAEYMKEIFHKMAMEAKLDLTTLPQDIRIRTADNVRYAFNYGQESVDLTTIFSGADNFKFIVGSSNIAAASVSIWEQI
ncbi:MAG: beta-galactosidase [Parasphingorhabdus sp.]|uniref:beta-galactosidase n=4 Tax=Parasphingorhabdus sp. TaxID=2709688 RepID=UPI0032636525